MPLIDTLYIEAEVADHPRTRRIERRYPNAVRIYCERYGEVFNPKSQNFRLQKRRPALILAKKHLGLLLKVPPDYGIGGERNFYFSHMLNCLYDCRYCFLQGMYRSAHYVLFVNYEDFEQAMAQALADHNGAETWFFSGYDCDSLALEPVTGFVEHGLGFFAQHPSAYLELRTKSTQVRCLLCRPVLPNVVVAFSFTPEPTSAALEHKVPKLRRRIDAMLQLQQQGWKLGLRFDPLIYQENYQQQYAELFAQIFAELHGRSLHSVSLGPFRLPRQYHKNIAKLYPEEPLFCGPLKASNGMVSYGGEREKEMMDFCTQALCQYVPERIVFPCVSVA